MELWQMCFAFVIPLALFLMFVSWVVAGPMDRKRIRRYIETRGGKLLKATWDPFGPGWFGGNKERIYQVRYFDHDGNVHEAYARTSMWTGVYFTEAPS